MSLSNTTVKTTYVGDGANTTFAITPDIISDGASEIQVWLRDETNPLAATETLQVITTNYTLTGGTPPTDVEMNVAPTSDQKLIIIRQVAKTQPTNYDGNGPFPAESHETALDRATALIQEAFEVLDRVPHLRITEQFGSMEMPQPKANGFLGFNATPDALVLLTPDEMFSLIGALLQVNNLSDVSNKDTSLSNIMSTFSAALADASGPDNVSGWTLDAANFSSAMYAVEIQRNSGAVISNLFILLQRRGGAWAVEVLAEGGDNGGVAFSVTEAGGVAQVRTTTDAQGTGTIKVKRITFNV